MASTETDHGSPDSHLGWVWRLALFSCCVLGAQWLLSPLGFNPTDDGFILAQSRRILSGEIPHRDFITIRPAGSACLHVVELVLGGDRAFLLSRFFYWLEVAAACWAWIEIAIARFGLTRVTGLTLPLGALAFMLSTHAFPPMAWHTVDGILLASLGFLATGSRRRGVVALGYLAIGAAVVCKQNFLPLVPVAILANGHARRPMAWFSALAPAAAYVTSILLAGGGTDLWIQLRAMTGLSESGLQPYVRAPWFLIGVVSGAIAAAGWPRPQTEGSGWRAAWPSIVVCLPVLFAGVLIDGEGFTFLDRGAFMLLGLVTGATLAAARAVPVGPGLFLIALGWCSAVSKGYQSPAHLAGPLAGFAALLIVALARAPGRRVAIGAATAGTIVALAIVAPHWWAARHDHILHEATAPLLTHDLAGVFPGARGIRTNARTHAVLSDLRDAVASVRGRPYSILVDGAAWWACAPERNPLPADWPQSIELPTEELQERFSQAIVDRRGSVALIIQKAHVGSLGEALLPIDPRNKYFGAASWARYALPLSAERRFWSIHE